MFSNSFFGLHLFMFLIGFVFEDTYFRSINVKVKYDMTTMKYDHLFYGGRGQKVYYKEVVFIKVV